MTPNLAWQQCEKCGAVRHTNANGDLSTWYHRSRDLRIGEHGITVVLTTCDACKRTRGPEGKETAGGRQRR